MIGHLTFSVPAQMPSRQRYVYNVTLINLPVCGQRGQCAGVRQERKRKKIKYWIKVQGGSEVQKVNFEAAVLTTHIVISGHANQARPERKVD